MRLKTVVSVSTLAAFVATWAMGCGQGTDIPLAKVPPESPGTPQPLPKDLRKGGGPGSSGNMKRNPGAGPLAR
jgi:hypothetical protein